MLGHPLGASLDRPDTISSGLRLCGFCAPHQCRSAEKPGSEQRQGQGFGNRGGRIIGGNIVKLKGITR